jgi:hypothetical protein
MARDDGSLTSVLGHALGAAASSLTRTSVQRWAKGRRPTFGRLLRGVAAGAGAAAILVAAKAILRRGDPESRGPAEDILDELLAGAGKGVLYAALLDPLLPGPPAAKGALAGTVDYLASPFGGLYSRLQPLSPIRKIPVVSILLETGDAEPDPYLVYLVQGALLGVLYGDPGEDV